MNRLAQVGIIPVDHNHVILYGSLAQQECRYKPDNQRLTTAWVKMVLIILSSIMNIIDKAS